MFCNIEHCIQRKLNFSSRLHRTREMVTSARRLRQGTTLNVVYWHSACLQSRATLSIRFKAGDTKICRGLLPHLSWDETLYCK
jgi:hypothetical protein